MLLLALVLGCADGSDDDDGDAASDGGGDAADGGGEADPVGCEPSDAPSLVIGQGAGSEFAPIVELAEVGLDVAPQGGFGVSVRASTVGLSTDAPVDVLLDTRIDGELVGHFVSEGQTLYCQDDGTGLIWGVVVGFDPDIYTTNDDLLALDGQQVELVVGVTTPDGNAESSVDVVISVGG